jgi:hypothetical protein
MNILTIVLCSLMLFACGGAGSAGSSSNPDKLGKSATGFETPPVPGRSP